jgi:hypothetical protein
MGGLLCSGTVAYYSPDYSPERVREVPERILKGRERLKRRPGAERLRKSGMFVMIFTRYAAA